MIATLLSGAGLSFATGLNAYLPLLILALTDRASSGFDLPSPYSGISSNLGIFFFLLVLPLELVGDKIPKLDHYNDLLHTAIRPLAGAFASMAVASESGAVNPWLAGAIGLAIAAAIHLRKIRARSEITIATSGLGNPFVSLLEDGVALAIGLLSIAIPIANLAAIPGGAFLLTRAYNRVASGKSRLVRAFQPRERP